MTQLELIPNTSLGEFILGKNIKDYSHIPHNIIRHEDESYSYNSYKFEENGVTLWTDENDNISTIRCTKQCFWKQNNLIKMTINDFLIKYEAIPDEIETLYVPINEDRGQNQTVYSFNNQGLMIWTWRNRIKTVLISNNKDD